MRILPTLTPLSAATRNMLGDLAQATWPEEVEECFARRADLPPGDHARMIDELEGVYVHAYIPPAFEKKHFETLAQAFTAAARDSSAEGDHAWRADFVRGVSHPWLEEMANLPTSLCPDIHVMCHIYNVPGRTAHPLVAAVVAETAKIPAPDDLRRPIIAQKVMTCAQAAFLKEEAAARIGGPFGDKSPVYR